jgi:hypothetical protein
LGIGVHFMPHVLKGSKIPKPAPSLCQGYCGVCGKVAQADGVTPILLATFIHADGNPLSVCARCCKWWKVKEGTRVKRVDT